MLLYFCLFIPLDGARPDLNSSHGLSQSERDRPLAKDWGGREGGGRRVLPW